VPASASARRYATAVFNVATESGDYDAWLNVLGELSRILRMPSARTIFLSPSVPTEQKVAALEQLLPSANPMIRNFVRILAQRDRLGEVPDIADALHELINQQRGVVTAEVTTAIALDRDLERVIAGRLAAHLGRDPDKVSILSRVDPSIIGGVVARVGDQVIDDSVRGRIERLRRTLAG
jgi:F-type H+-transporting ATPase subunit delta